MSPEPSSDSLVISLVESARSLPADPREEFLETIRISNPDIYAEVKRRVCGRIDGEECTQTLLPGPAPRKHTGGGAVSHPGEVVAGRFRIVRELGRGGMGIVYQAEDGKLHRKVALKCGKPGHQNRLTPEARAALEVSHPNVCKLHELHTAETAFGPVDFLTMEFIQGESLAALLDRSGPLTPKKAAAVAEQICAGLAQAHRQGIIHGDLKTANILLADSPGGTVRAVLTDFGLARFVLPGDTTQTIGPRGGTLNYMAPELLEGARPSVASDIFALGVLFHRMLTGKQVAVGVRPDLPKPWDRMVARCLAVDPERRFKTVDQVAAVLNRRRSVVRWLLAAALLMIAVLAVVIWRAPDTAGPPVRLAILPVIVEGAPIASASGLGTDIADRLSGVRKRFTVVAPDEARRDRVDTVVKAKSDLRATHVLRIHLRNNPASVAATAQVIDASSGQVLRELNGDYAPGDQAVLARALLATVTGAFRLRSRVPRESVSGPAYPYYVQGTSLMRRDSLSADEAIPYFRKAIDADPQSALPWAGLATAQIQKFQRGAGQQWLDAAELSVAKAMSMNSDALPVLLAAGRLAEEHGRYETAIADLSRATELDPGSSDAWRSLARAFEKTNRAAEALVTYRKAIDAQPDSYWPYLALGRFYLIRNRFQDAEEMYRKVTILAPSFADGHVSLGLALMEQGRFDEAEKSMLQALSLSRTAQNLSNTGALYYEQERYAEAARFFEESLSTGPPSIVRYRNLGDALRHLGRRKESEEAYRSGISLAESELARDPRRAYSRAQLALLTAQTGDVRRAEFELTQALALEPENALVMRDVVIGFEVLGRRDMALELLRRAPAEVLLELNRSPDAKNLRLDRRFQDMILRNPNAK